MKIRFTDEQITTMIKEQEAGEKVADVCRRQFGCRRVHVMIAREGFSVNHKKVKRMYIEEKLQVRRRGVRPRALGTRKPIVLANGPNQR